MSKSVNVSFAKCFIIFMAIVILVEGAGYLGLSIWGITFHNCAGENSSPVNQPFEFVLNLVYFSSKTCGAPSIFIEQASEFVTLSIDWRVAEAISTREFIFLILYAVLSALWVITSLMVLATICTRITKVVVLSCYWPWLVVVLGCSILDVVATGYHIHDIVHTTSANSTFDYVGVTQLDIVTEFLQEYDIYFVTPAVTFTLISSRVVLVWLLNIFGAIFCLSLANVLLANSSKKKRERQHRLPVDTTHPTQPQRQMATGYEPQMQEIQRQESVVIQYQPTAPPDAGRRERRTLEPLKSPPAEVAQAPAPIYPPPVVRQESTTNNKRVSELKTQASVTPEVAPTYQSSDAHPENLDYPNNRYSSMSSQPPPRSATPELSAVSPLNMRYSTTEGLPFPSQAHVTQDLRNQLPWSYTNIMNDPVAQKRIQAHLQPDDDDLPPIPVPDYTLHHPKKERPDSQSKEGYSRW